MTSPSHPGPILVTGATGYIGGLLVPSLLDAGHTVRVLTRSADRLRGTSWADRVEVVAGDASRAGDLDHALTGIKVAYYLLHSMDGKGDFTTRDRRLARGFAEAARRAGVRRIVYLSGLHPDGPLSAHLGSRVEVGRILLDSGVPTIVLQAGVVLGAGSASFDMLRHLTERLPAMFGPKWLNNRIQPIAIDDVLHYLVGACDVAGDVTRTFDIAGPDVLTYKDMIKAYARLAGLGTRAVGTVPLLTPKLASHWVGLVTPVRSGIARPLVGSLIHDAVAKEQDILDVLGPPSGGRTSFDEAIRRALADVDPTRWRRTLRQVAAATAACAVAGSLLTDTEGPWYRALRKPAWQPPGAAFPVVWTSLYTATTLAATATITQLEESGQPDRAREFRAAYAVNLALNTAWSALFFSTRALPAATAEAAILAASSADLARRASRTSPANNAIFAAYAGWAAFATALTWAIERRNQNPAS